jgi:hypothetical protein
VPKPRRNNLGKGPASAVPPAVLGLKRFAAISAVEGLKLSVKGRKRVSAALSNEKRRADIIKAYLEPKGRR